MPANGRLIQYHFFLARRPRFCDRKEASLHRNRARSSSCGNQSVENTPEQVEDTVGKLCGRSRDTGEKYRFLWTRNCRGFNLVMLRKDRRYDAVILSGTTLREKNKSHNNDGRQATPEKELRRVGVCARRIHNSTVFTESHLDKLRKKFPT